MFLLIKKFFLSTILTIFAIIVAEKVIPNFSFDGSFWLLIKLSLIVTALHFLLKPILKIIFLPLIWITFGFFSIVINMMIFQISSMFFPGMIVFNFLSLILVSMIISLVNYPLQWMK